MSKEIFKDKNLIYEKLKIKNLLKALIFEQRYFDDTPTVENDVIDVLSQYNSNFICKNKKKILGLIKGGKINKENYEIYCLSVHEKYRELGIGFTLLKLCIKNIKKLKFKKIKLFCDIKNYKALNLYLKFNFKIKEVKENISKKVKKAYLMELNIF